MKTLFICTVMTYSISAYASLNCFQQCPIQYDQSASNYGDFIGHQRCLDQCNFQNNQQNIMQRQAQELEEQNELLRKQLDEQRQLRRELQD